MKLHILVEKYIDYRKSLGEKMKLNSECLKLFIKKLGKHTFLSDVSEQDVKNFLYSSHSITKRWFSKYSSLAGFYRYAIT